MKEMNGIGLVFNEIEPLINAERVDFSTLIVFCMCRHQEESLRIHGCIDGYFLTFQLLLKKCSISSRDLPFVSGMKKNIARVPMQHTPANNQNIP